jgi:hypothetical protein
MVNGSSNHLLPTPGTPLTPDGQNLSGCLSSQGNHHLEDTAKADVQPLLSRLPSSQFSDSGLSFEVFTFRFLLPLISFLSPMQQYSVDSVYGLAGQLDGSRYGALQI